MNRRQFLWQTGLAAGLVRAQADDPVASSPPARWAMQQLQDALAARGVSGGPSIVAAGLASPVAREILKGAAPTGPEALALAPGKIDGRPVLLAAGSDPRGLVYALLELADRVSHGADSPPPP